MNIQSRRDTADNWTLKNPILLEGEIGIELPNRFKVGNGINHWTALPYSDKVLTDEINRLQSKINAEPDKVYTYRGKTPPVIPSEPMLGYYLTFYSMPQSGQLVTFPDVDLPEGTIFSIDNNDKNDSISYKPRSGDKIDNKINLVVTLAPNSVAFLVKTSDGWQTAYSGIVADNLTKLITLIKPLLPTGSGLTIDEIQAQLKDRLHTFSEIQTEFSSQLHTVTDLESKGFQRFVYDYGFQAGTTPPISNSFVIGENFLNEEKLIPAVNEGDKNLLFIVSTVAEPLIGELYINNAEAEYTTYDFVDNEISKKLLITNDTVDTNQTVRIKFNFAVSQGTGSSLTIDDGATNSAGINKINVKGMHITELSGQGSMASGEIELTAGANIHMAAPNQQYGLGIVDEIIVEPPLSVYDDTSSVNNNALRFTMEHNVFEPLQSPGMLAYLTEETEVLGKIYDTEKHHKGALWFDDVVVPSGTFIQDDKTNKSYGIQDWTEDDPNVTGGVNYLIAFRAGFKGTAPNNGIVRIGLIKKHTTPFDDGVGFLEDVNGQPVVVERHYKLGEKLGVLDAMGIVNAKGMQEFQAVVIDDFSDNILILEDRTESATGLMIQCIKSSKTGEAKTGNALQQFELDTQQNIEFSSHYLGVDRMSLAYINSRPKNPVSYTAETKSISIDRNRLINLNGIKVGVVDRHTHIEDDGVHIADFNFGRIFSAEETQMLRSKDIDVTITLVDKNMGFNVALMKWLGKPDEFTPEIFTTRNGNGAPEFQTNWANVSNLFISEDIVMGDHTLSKTFTVPADANNYAIIIYPIAAARPLILKLKELKVDVNPAFTGYVLHAPELLGEIHLAYDEEYKQFIQDNQGYAALRYTINANELPAPVGELGKGLADISLDTTVNKIPGSVAKGGEGAIVFQKEGTATIHTGLRLWSEQASGTKSEVNFWYAKVLGTAGSEIYDKIAGSETTIEVGGGARNVQYYMKSFTIQVKAGDKIALRMKADKTDGAFLQSTSPNTPLVNTNIKFKELVTGGEDDPGTLYEADLDEVQFERNLSTNKIQLKKSIEGLDLSEAGFVAKNMVVASFNFTNNASAIIIPIDVPNNVIASVMSIHYTEGDFIKEGKMDYLYDTINKEFRFNIGTTGKTGQIVIGFIKNTQI